MALKPFYDEMYAADGSVRPQYAGFAEWLNTTPPEKIAQNREAADLMFHRVGITFAVYGETTGTERLIPFDIVPHIIPGKKWEIVARGLTQRITALNAFLHDVYHQQNILKAGKVPADKVTGNSQFRPEMMHIDVPGGIYAHVAGIDLVKDADGEYYVLEDNLRTPSGVSYLLENRKMMMRLFPELFAARSIRPVSWEVKVARGTKLEASAGQGHQVVGPRGVAMIRDLTHIRFGVGAHGHDLDEVSRWRSRSIWSQHDRDDRSERLRERDPQIIGLGDHRVRVERDRDPDRRSRCHRHTGAGRCPQAVPDRDLQHRSSAGTGTEPVRSCFQFELFHEIWRIGGGQFHDGGGLSFREHHGAGHGPWH